MNSYDNLFNKKESLENEKTEKNIAALEDIFKNSVNFEEDTISLGSYNYDSSRNNENDKSSFSFTDNIQKNEPSIDPFNTTSEISKVDLEKALNNDLGNDLNALKKLRGALSDYDKDFQDSPKEETQGSSQSNGKVLVKSTNPIKKYSSDDVSEILQAFISCSILSFVTAGMGVGWLLYIIMHI